jgi:hypothetical protein
MLPWAVFRDAVRTAYVITTGPSAGQLATLTFLFSFRTERSTLTARSDGQVTGTPLAEACELKSPITGA